MLLGLARPLLERAGERMSAAEIAHMIKRLKVPPSRTERREDMWEIVIPRSDKRGR